jgi:hypothetical protein
MQNNKLSLQERLASIAILQFFIVLTAIVAINQRESLPRTNTFDQKPTKITISVTGACWYPGDYQVTKGTLLQDVLALATPYPEANLKGLKLEVKQLRDRKLVINQKKTIEIKGEKLKKIPEKK